MTLPQETEPHAHRGVKERISGKETTWEILSEKMRSVGKVVLGETSGKAPKVGKDTWWWNEEVQQAIAEKRNSKRTRDQSQSDEAAQQYKAAAGRKRKWRKQKVRHIKIFIRRGKMHNTSSTSRESLGSQQGGVKRAIKRMKTGKAVGPNGIPMETWKSFGEGVEWLTKILNTVPDD
ncbi:uncharacterized protein LOC125026900 [Penaeus chinensis]|uniref:uncharacterized protein LOC125026900 n=1 Tax=Penaeus chinensis TaxID=139456 RepID=UPI001FB5A965|nr:uncharacterized protein LOC125026900 [Penaeus chinensis]